jgi:hypothetical protein
VITRNTNPVNIGIKLGDELQLPGVGGESKRNEQRSHRLMKSIRLPTDSVNMNRTRTRITYSENGLEPAAVHPITR